MVDFFWSYSQLVIYFEAASDPTYNPKASAVDALRMRLKTRTGSHRTGSHQARPSPSMFVVTERGYISRTAMFSEWLLSFISAALQKCTKHLSWRSGGAWMPSVKSHCVCDWVMTDCAWSCLPNHVIFVVQTQERWFSVQHLMEIG